MQNRIEIVTADITTLHVDAIVNAANRTLLGGGGVDGAIHRAAGTQLLEECRSLQGCETGEAKMTKAYNLPAQFIIHTVGPIWHDGHHKEPELLAACYQNSLQIAFEHQFKTIAFPAISTGVYRFPPQQAAEIAVKTVKKWLANHDFPQKIIFCCFSKESVALHQRALHG